VERNASLAKPPLLARRAPSPRAVAVTRMPDTVTKEQRLTDRHKEKMPNARVRRASEANAMRSALGGSTGIHPRPSAELKLRVAAL
jgi:hypothetical protein